MKIDANDMAVMIATRDFTGVPFLSLNYQFGRTLKAASAVPDARADTERAKMAINIARSLILISLLPVRVTTSA